MSIKLLAPAEVVKCNNTCTSVYHSGMAKRPLPRESLIRNLNYLMRAEKLSESALSKRSGVAQKTINNIRNGVSAPTLDTVEALAAAFNLTGWHLIMPNLPEDLISGNSLEKLYSAYTSASQEGRGYIDHVAEREAHYKGTPDKGGNFT